jgi:hypothetical protein
MRIPVVGMVFFIFFLVGAAHAQLFIEDGKVSLAVSGGERVEKSINVDNTSGEGQNVKVYWEDFQYQPPYDGTKSFLPAGTAPRSASQWVTCSPQEFHLDSFGKQRVDCIITIPAQIDGGYYGVLFFEKEEAPAKEQIGVNIVTRVGSLFFIEPKDKVKKAVIQDIKLVANALVGQFVNQGNVVLVPRMTYYVLDEGGMVANRGEAKKLYVPPGASAVWEIPLPENLGTGRHTFVVNCDLEEGDVVVKEIDLAGDSSGNLTIQGVRD